MALLFWFGKEKINNKTKNQTKHHHHLLEHNKSPQIKHHQNQTP